MIKEVIIVFKTHLDIGYTDYASNVTDKYLDEFIPNALRIAEELKNTDTPFIWTTGSWLINEALKRGNKRLEEAIKDGLITWHALPFTSHTEIMSKGLFEYGLSISKKLDKRFGKKTIGAKMTDVPGHTKAMIPLLKNAGVELLHIGVNPASPLPSVPDAFRWRHGNDEITVMYNSGYGNIIEVGKYAFCFSITNDNLGPCGTQNIKDTYARLREKYPNAIVHAGTLNDIAECVRCASLPIVNSEIGDSWIHGMQSDPTKMRAYKSVLRHADKLEGYDLDTSLLLVPEHTWGMCLQRYLADDGYYKVADFDKIGGKDTVTKSWDEQREYVTKAARIMGIDISDDMRVEVPCLVGAKKIIAEPSFDILYQAFDVEDMRRYERDYLTANNLWAISDYLKPGIPKDFKGGKYKADCTGAYEVNGDRVFILEFEEGIREECGLPTVYVIENDEGVEIRWFGKKNNRMPEAFWAHPKGYGDNFKLIKMGELIDPDKSVYQKSLHAAEAVINGTYRIELTDSCLVAPYGTMLYRWGEEMKSDLYFNLYNNKWNTNFPAWFSDDARFRFKIIKIQ